jgi:hypothetical protein
MPLIKLSFSEMEKETELDGEAAGEKTWGKPEQMIFSARTNQEADDLKSKAILQTTTASTATMTLFTNMGVSVSRVKQENDSFIFFIWYRSRHSITGRQLRTNDSKNC